MILTNDALDAIRFLLHDNDRVSDTGEQFYSSDTIARAWTDALAALVRELLQPPPDPRTGIAPVRSAHLSVAPLAAQWTPSWTGAFPNALAPLPDDFFFLECGILNGLYVPACDADMGESIAGTTIARLYAAGGNLYGPLVQNAYYFVRPPVLDPASQSPLDLLSDAVWNCAKQAAARDLMVQHAKSGYHRWVLLNKEYLEMKATLQ